MIKNYLISAYRNLLRTKVYSLVNILGLAIGMTACLMIMHYVNFERSYDKFHENSDRIYRLRYERTDNSGAAVKFASCTPPAAARIRGNYPEVEKIGRILQFGATVSYEDVKFVEDRIFYAEPEFLQILKFEFIKGDPLNDLNEPDNAFLSQSLAYKYFGDQNPIGKTISLNKKRDYKIVGIFKDIPENSHLKFDILLPWKNLEALYGPEYTEAWGHTGSYTYLLAKPGIDAASFERKLLSLVAAECPWLEDYEMTIDLKMQPLVDIHLTSHYMQEYEANGNSESVNFLFLIAFFIIVMAWLNYLNLSTARSLTRAREVGLRKVVGASRGQLVSQFFFEVLIINVISILIAFAFISLTISFFNGLTGIPPDYTIWFQNWFWIAVAIMLFAGVLLSGLYPVTVLSSFKPVTALRGKLIYSGGGFNLRKALVVIQFSVGLFLIIATFVVFKQLSFMRNQELGFNMEQTVVVKAPRVRDGEYGSKFESFKESLLQIKEISNVTHATEVPGRQIYWDAGAIRKAGDDISKGKNYQIVGIDYNYTDLFELEFVAGRNFSKDFPSDEKALILNETAVQFMGFENAESAIGEKVDYWQEIYPIVGVLKDFHQQSLKEAYEPHIYRFMPYGRGASGMIAMKLNSQNVRETIGMINQNYDEFFPGNPLDFFFLDDYYNQQYKSDELFGKVYSLFTLLAIIITVLGIYGLSLFSVTQLTKQIAIRKVLGASVFSIMRMLTNEFLILLTIANLLAWPIAYYAMSLWLERYAYRTDIGVGVFIMAGVLIMFISLLTVSFQVFKAARANPVETIQCE